MRHALRFQAADKPYCRLIETGLHLGYRRLRGRAGDVVHAPLRRRAELRALRRSARSPTTMPTPMAPPLWIFSRHSAPCRRTSRKRPVRLTVHDAIEAVSRDTLRDGGKQIDEARYRPSADPSRAGRRLNSQRLQPSACESWLAALAGPAKRKPRRADAEVLRRQDQGKPRSRSSKPHSISRGTRATSRAKPHGAGQAIQGGGRSAAALSVGRRGAAANQRV